MRSRFRTRTGILAPVYPAEDADWLAAWQHGLMWCLRTPEDCFAGLPGFDYPPRYADAGGVRLAWVEAGPPDGEPPGTWNGSGRWRSTGWTFAE
jgi:hypothetical protein